MMDVLITKPPETSEVVDEISLIKQNNNQSSAAQEAGGQGGGRKRTVSKSKSTTSNNSTKQNVVVWPEFKVPLPDPELGRITVNCCNLSPLLFSTYSSHV